MRNFLMWTLSFPLAIWLIVKNGFSLTKAEIEVDELLQRTRHRAAGAKEAQNKLDNLYQKIIHRATKTSMCSEIFNMLSTHCEYSIMSYTHCSHPDGQPACSLKFCPVMTKFKLGLYR